MRYIEDNVWPETSRGISTNPMFTDATMADAVNIPE